MVPHALSVLIKMIPQDMLVTGMMEKCSTLHRPFTFLTIWIYYVGVHKTFARPLHSRLIQHLRLCACRNYVISAMPQLQKTDISAVTCQEQVSADVRHPCANRGSKQISD